MSEPDSSPNPLEKAMHDDPTGRAVKSVVEFKLHWEEHGASPSSVPLVQSDPAQPHGRWFSGPDWISGWTAFEVFRLQTEPYQWAPPIARICATIADQFDRDTAGGLLSAAGIGALLSPPTLGAAAFIIAEYLEVSYLKVLAFATIPTVLYYFSCLLMMEADARRQGTVRVEHEVQSLWALTKRYGYHFSSLVVTGSYPLMAWAISA